MPWYDKLSLSVALALVTVLGTMAAAAHDRAWNARTFAFLLMAVLIAGAMAALTYYYHVHEDEDEGGGDANVASVSVRAPLPYGRGSVSQPLLLVAAQFRLQSGARQQAGGPRA